MNPIEAARPLLPPWIGWSNLAFCLGAVFCLSAGCAGLSAWLVLPSRRKLQGAGWIDRARLIYPCRFVTVVNLILLPVLFGLSATEYVDPFARVPADLYAVLAGAIALAGAWLMRIRFQRRFSSLPRPLSYWVRGCFSTALILCPHLLILVVTGLLLPERFTAQAAIWFSGAVFLIVFFSWGGGIFVALAVGLARPASKRLRAVVDRAAGRVGVRPRASYELILPYANAFALPFCRRLVFTDTALAVLTDDELTAICAHELGHLTEPPSRLLIRLLGTWMLMPLAAVRPIIGSFGLHIFATVNLLSVVCLVLIGRMARRLEERADVVAHTYEGDSGTYARALERIYETNLVPAVLTHKRAVHPHLYDRLLRAGVEPVYPRPRPPSRRRMTAGVLLAFVVASAACTGLLLLPDWAVHAYWGNSSVLSWSMAVHGGGAKELTGLAYLRGGTGDLHAAIVLYSASCEADRKSAYYPANLAVALTRAGRYQEANTALAEATRRSRVNGDKPGEREVVTQASLALANSFAGLGLANSSDRSGTEARDPTEKKAIIDAVLKVADALQRNDLGGAKTQAAATAKDVREIADVMFLFKLRKDDHADSDLQVLTASGNATVETTLMSLANPLLPGDSPTQISPDLARMAFVIEAVALVAEVRADTDGEEAPKKWRRFSQALADNARRLAKAALAKDPAQVKNAAARITGTCKNCHDQFR